MAYTIIVADDSPSVQKILQMAFAHPEFEVVVFSDGQELLRSMDRLEPDAVLLNLSLPLRDGYEVAESLRQKEGGAGVPIILLKEAFEPLDKDRLETLAYDDLVQKPFDSERLVRRVRAMIEKKNAPATLPEEPVREGMAAELPAERETPGAVRDLVKQEILGMERELEKRIRARVVAELRMWLINNHKKK